MNGSLLRLGKILRAVGKHDDAGLLEKFAIGEGASREQLERKQREQDEIVRYIAEHGVENLSEEARTVEKKESPGPAKQKKPKGKKKLKKIPGVRMSPEDKKQYEEQLQKIREESMPEPSTPEEEFDWLKEPYEVDVGPDPEAEAYLEWRKHNEPGIRKKRLKRNRAQWDNINIPEFVKLWSHFAPPGSSTGEKFKILDKLIDDGYTPDEVATMHWTGSRISMTESDLPGSGKKVKKKDVEKFEPEMPFASPEDVEEIPFVNSEDVEEVPFANPEDIELLASLNIVKNTLHEKGFTMPHNLETEKLLSAGQKEEIFMKLAEIADRLDKIGAAEEADIIDGFLLKYAQVKEANDVLDWKGEDQKSDQSKRYDSKYHRSIQVRDQDKKNQTDREGRAEHHATTYRPIDGSLSTRYCPHHVGSMMGRVGENTYQCPIDNTVYNWEVGYTDANGNDVPGASVAGQTPGATGYFETPSRVFDTREQTLNRIN